MPGSHIHCSLGERAFTNLITNATQFNGIDLQKHVRQMLHAGGFPREALSSVLHESVHHWCFMTPVGCTLALLEASSYMSAMRWAASDDDRDALEAMDHHWKYEVTTLLLRPLAEGMAQFFEYDVMPYPATQVASIPIIWAYAFFGHPTKEEIESAWGQSLLKVLGESRTSEPVIRRKTNLLLQTLRCDDGGYLPGYLMVKNLWRSTRRRHDAFYDADLFASLLRRYLYGDYGLVDCILEKKDNPAEWIMSVVDYLGYRINRFLKLDLAAAKKVLVETMLSPPKKQYHVGWVRLSQNPPMDTDPEIADRGLKRTDDLIQSLQKKFDGTAFVDRDYRLENVPLLPLAYRHLLWLGELEVALKESDGKKVEIWLDGESLITADVLPDAGVLPEIAQIDIYVSVYDYFLGGIVAVGGKPIAHFLKGGVDARTKQEFLNLSGERQRAEGLYEALAKSYEIVADVYKVQPLHKELLKLAAELMEGIYEPGALLCVPNESRQSVSKMMKKDGLLGVLDGDLSLLKSAAALSLGAAIRLFPEEVPGQIPSFRQPVEDVLAKLDRVSDSKNFPIVFGKKGIELESFI